MTASTEPRGGLDLGWSSGEDGWGDAMNANLLRLSRLGFHPSVLSATTTAPPGSPVSGSGYIIPSGATGAWAGKTGQVAVWDGSAWAYAVPRDGWTMHVDGAGLTTYYNGIWSQANVVTASGIGAGTSSLALGSDSTTAHRGDHGTTAYDHSQATGNPHGTTAADVGALASANPNFTGNLLQDGDQRITPSGGGRFTDLSLTTLAAGSNLPVVSDAAGVIRNKTTGEFRTIIGAAASAGVTDGSDAASGVVGQYYEVFLPEASFVYAVNGSPVAVLSLSLPAGDWLVEGRATAHITGAMNGNKVVSGLNTSIAIPTDGTEVYGGLQVFSATNGFQTMTGSKRFSLSTTTTVYLVAQIDFSAGTPALFGCMSARRMR